MISQNRLRTPRLTIRQLKQKDLSGLHELHSDPEATQYTGGVWTLGGTRVVLQTTIASYERRHMEWYAVAHPGTGAFLGVCFLTPVSPRFCEELGSGPHVELGYRFIRRHWGQGYATEVAEAMLEWGFTKLNLDEIVSIVLPDNVASERVLRKLGMTHRQTFYPGVEPAKLYAISRAEFAARRHRA